MASFLLVHGSWLGGWCWREVRRRLESFGHEVTDIDLPGHGADSARAGAVTMDDYVTAVLDAADSIMTPFILAGHSSGGVVASQVAEARPEAMRALIAVASIQPPPGASMMQAVEGVGPEYLKSMVWSPDGKTAAITPEGVRRFLCNRCSADIAAEVAARITPEPVGPFTEPI